MGLLMVIATWVICARIVFIYTSLLKADVADGYENKFILAFWLPSLLFDEIVFQSLPIINKFFLVVLLELLFDSISGNLNVSHLFEQLDDDLYLAMMHSHSLDAAESRRLKIFQGADVDGTGVLSKLQVKDLCIVHDLLGSRSILDELIEKCDKDGSGKH